MIRPTNVQEVSQLHQTLLDLKLRGMADALAEQMGNPAFADMSFVERFSAIVLHERDMRQIRRLGRLLKESGIRNVYASLDKLIYRKDRNLDKALVTELSDLYWMEKEEPSSMLVTGSTGTGKTYLMEAFGMAALNKGMRVAYYRWPQFLERVCDAFEHREMRAFRRRLSKQKLLILDDFGMAPMNDVLRSELLSIIDERIGRYPTMIGSQMPVDDWFDYIGEPYTADAIMDRLRNNSYEFELEGKSLRQMEKETIDAKGTVKKISGST